jgi:hypothetical protein
MKILHLGIATAALATTQVLTMTGEAATGYSCPLTSATVCSSPLSGKIVGDVQTTSDGYRFNPSGDDTPGYVSVGNSNIINTGTFPIRVSVDVMGVGVPSRQVGDYDVVRGGANGTWKIEILAQKGRSIAQAGCHFKGTTGKTLLIGGPDFSKLSGWHNITCVDDGNSVQLFVDGSMQKSTNVKTGKVANKAPLFIGAKDTHGGDQFSGYAKNVTISVG